MAKVSNRFESVCRSKTWGQNLRTSMVIATIFSILYSNECLSFVFPSSRTITLTSPPRCSFLVEQEHLCILESSRRRTHITQLFAQKKKPRFSQKGSHISKKTPEEKIRNGSFARKNKSKNTGSNNKKGKRRPPPMQHQPWASGKSIDDLEATMSSRWGTLDDSSTSMAGGIPEGFEIFSGDEDDFETMDDYDVHYDDSSPPKKGNKNKNNMSGSDRWRKPVLDPWDEEEASSKKQRNNKFFGEREYYDQDDEGYEILGEMEDDDGDEFLEIDESISSPYLPRVDHLIAPKPAGGRGSNRNSNKNDGGGGYFFNPDVVNSRKKEDAPLFRKERKRDVSEPNSVAPESEEDIRTNKARKRRQSAKPLLNKNGQQRLLTIEEAFNQFQESVDEGMMEIIETAEVPILAKHANAKSWDDVGITSTTMLENLRYDMNCPNPLAVQEKTTPAILTGSDVLVGTYTGSGKTLSFLVPLVQRLLWSIDEDSDGNIINDPGLAVLIVVPGRELASQIVSVARDLLQDTGLSVQLAIGGTTFKRNLEQIRKRKPNIIVGTPGRIAELVVGKPGEKNGKLKIGSLQSLVLDEFDALLEYKAHRDPTRAIMQTLKRRHRNSLQSVMCSATATDIIDSSKVVDFLRPGFETAMADEDDVLVTGRKSNASSSVAAQVSRTVLHGVLNVPHKGMALDAVRKILHTDPIPQQILIFVENARKVDIVVEKLADRGIIAAPLHGGMGSEKMDRAEVSRALREGYVGIVVATELAARGLDAPLLTHVINLDLPTDASHYAHRSGRCGRGGRPGVVINITTSPKERNVPKRFANTLGVDMFTAETRGGKLVLVDPSTQTID